MNFKISSEEQVVIIYNLSSDTMEFIGVGEAYIPPYTGLPACSTDIAPPESPPGKVAVFDGVKSWNLVDDYRGEVVFDIESGNELFINKLGPLPKNTTLLKPVGKYQKWNGTEWVKDKEAEKAAIISDAESTKSRLMQEASNNIAPLQDAIDLEMNTEEDKKLLNEWKKYRVLISRIDTNEGGEIIWPEHP